MKPLLLTVIFMLSLFSVIYSQNWKLEWEKTSHYSKQDYFTDVCETPDGGFLVLGECGANKFADIWLVRYNQQGDTLWTRKTGTPGIDVPEKIVCAPNSDILILGKTVTGDESKVLLTRTNSDGNLLWQKILDDGNFYKAEDITALSDNGFIISGAKSSDPETPHLWMAKMDKNGDLIWEQIFSENLKGCLASVKQLPDNDFILSGQVSGKIPNDCDIIVIRTDENGKEVWQNRMEAPKTKEWPECVCCSPDSCFVLVGWAGKCLNDISDENPIFDYDLMIKKINCDGKVVWSKDVDSEGSEGGNAVALRPDGKFLVAGVKLTSFTGKIGPWLLEVDNEGNIIDELLLNMRLDQASKIINSSDGGFVVIGPGLHDRISSNSDGWILKFKGI